MLTSPTNRTGDAGLDREAFEFEKMKRADEMRKWEAEERRRDEEREDHKAEKRRKEADMEQRKAEQRERARKWEAEMEERNRKWEAEREDRKAEIKLKEAELGLEKNEAAKQDSSVGKSKICLLYTSPSPRDRQKSRMPSSA